MAGPISYPGVPIDQNVIPSNINAYIAQGPQNVPNLENAVKAFEQGEQSGYQTRNQNLFQNGLPLNPDGSVNWGAAVQQVVQAGGTPGMAAAGPLIRASLLGQQDSSIPPAPTGYGSGTDTGSTTQPAPSTSSSPVFPPSTQPGSRADTSLQPGDTLTPQQVAAANPNGTPQAVSMPPSAQPQTTPRQLAQQTGVSVDQLSDAAGVGPDEPIPMQNRNAVRQLLLTARQQPQQPGVPQPQPQQVAQPQPQPQIAQVTPNNNGMVAQDFNAAALQRQAQAWQARGDALTQRATRFDAIEKGSGEPYQKAAEDAYKKAQAIQQSLLQSGQPTNEQKNAGTPGPLTNLTAAQKFASDDAESFSKRADGFATLGENAQNGINRVGLMKGLIQSPGFQSGKLSEDVLAYNQFKTLFGGNANAAAPQETFQKNVNDILREQIQAMGKSGVGRVLQAEVNIMKQGIASLGVTPAANRAQLTMLGRVYQQEQAVSDIANQVRDEVASGRIKAGQYNSTLNARIAAYQNDPKNHLVSDLEKGNPALLGAVDAPAQSARWSPQQKAAWAQQQGLQAGDYIRAPGGQYVKLGGAQ